MENSTDYHIANHILTKPNEPMIQIYPSPWFPNKVFLIPRDEFYKSVEKKGVKR